MNALTVLFDAKCAFCVRCATWLLEQPAWLKVECLPADSVAARARFPTLVARAEELMVVDGEGGVYVGPDAFIMALWGLWDFQDWAERLARPVLKPLARRAFGLLSSQRHRLSRWLIRQDDDALSRGLMAETDPVRCEEDACGREPAVAGRHGPQPTRQTAPQPPLLLVIQCTQCGHCFPRGREYCPACLSAAPARSCANETRTAG
jgi:predicted DCC family thiol-disulfide oxidoreductase YuxK